MRLSDDRKNPFGLGRPWAELTGLQRVSYVMDIAVIAVVCLIAAGLLWFLCGMPGLTWSRT